MKRLLLLIATLCLANVPAYTQQHHLELSAKQVAKAEKLIARLERLDALTLDDWSSPESQSLARKLSSSIRQDISDFPDSDVKTDLTTALRFYERGGTSSQEQSHASNVRCEQERPGMYQKLCETTTGGPRNLLWNKARLHTVWAKAAISKQKGLVDAKDESALGEMEAERRFDLELAENAVVALKRLEKEVLIYRTLGEFIEGRALACVSFEKFTADLEEVRQTLKANLNWLPESRLKNELRNAMLSYLDGHFWWKQVYRPAVIYAGNNYTEESMTPVRLGDPETVKYTVVINWRQAHQYTNRAAELLKSMK